MALAIWGELPGWPQASAASEPGIAQESEDFKGTPVFGAAAPGAWFSLPQPEPQPLSTLAGGVAPPEFVDVGAVNAGAAVASIAGALLPQPLCVLVALLVEDVPELQSSPPPEVAAEFWFGFCPGGARPMAEPGCCSNELAGVPAGAPLQSSP